MGWWPRKMMHSEKLLHATEMYFSNKLLVFICSIPEDLIRWFFSKLSFDHELLISFYFCFFLCTLSLSHSWCCIFCPGCPSLRRQMSLWFVGNYTVHQRTQQKILNIFCWTPDMSWQNSLAQHNQSHLFAKRKLNIKNYPWHKRALKHL